MNWIQRVFGRRRIDADLAEELREHLEEKIDALVAQGVSHHDAVQRARREFGNVALVEEQARDVWKWHWVEDFFRQDVVYGLRALRRNPGFSLVAILSLAVAIAANTTIFTLINTLVLQPVQGVHQPHGLVRLTNGNFSYPQLAELQRQGLLEAVIGFNHLRVPADLRGRMEWTQVAFANGTYFPALGVQAAIGRTLTPEDEHAQATVAVLSHSFWRRAFAADPSILGQTIQVRRVPLTIVGVTPPEFVGLVMDEPTDITMPLTLAPRIWTELRSDVLTRPTARWIRLMGRVASDESVTHANDRFQIAWPHVMKAVTPPQGAPAIGALTRQRVDLVSAWNGFSETRSNYRDPLLILMALVGLVLLIACANVANLLLARGTARRSEFSIRLSMGASRARVIRQLLTESALLAGLAAAAGLLLAVLGTRTLVKLISPGNQPVPLDVLLDWPVLVFAIVVTGLTVLLFGLMPALRSVRVMPSLNRHGRTTRSGSRLLRGLVVAQVALSMVLVVGAGLFISSLRNVLAVDPGFDATNVLLVRADPAAADYRGARVPQFFTEFLDRVSALPHVQSAAMSWAPPLALGQEGGGDVRAEGAVPAASALSNYVSPRYFDTIGQQLMLGRTFTDLDHAGSPRVAVVNESFARHFFGNENAVGRKFDPNGRRQFDCEIVGVVQDALYGNLKDARARVFYIPYAQGPRSFLERENMVLEVRTDSAGVEIGAAIRSAAGQLDTGVIVEIQTLQSHLEGSLGRDRFLAVLSSAFGVVSLLLVAIGLFGVMAYSVAKRTAEFGVRMALGAQPTAVLSMVLREGLRLVAIGIAIGGAAALAASQAIGGLLFAVSPHDALAFAAAAGAMTVAALLAALLPARRAARVDPIVALRSE
jgi:predicted permease